MNKLITNPLIGADIEVFLRDKITQSPISAEGIIKGTKDEPFNFDSSNKYYAISLDNVAAEFCIPPSLTKEEFLHGIKKGINYINSVIPKELEIFSFPAAIFEDKWLQTENAKTFGCEPDYNVWLREINPKPEAPNPNLRSCGGHIHLGYTIDEQILEAMGKEKMIVDEWVIKAMDAFVGLPSVILEPNNERKLLYGKAGCFRFKPYGVEYRTVSNYYLKNDELTSFIFNNSLAALDFINNGRIEEIESLEGQIRFAIDNCNHNIASSIINHLEIPIL